MLDIISVVLSSVSVYQGWRQEGNANLECKELAKFLDMMQEIDTIFFEAKTVHDSCESFARSTRDTSKVLKESYDNVSFNKLDRSLVAFVFHLDRMIEKYPAMSMLTGSFDDGSGEKLITPQIKSNLEMLYRFYPAMCKCIERLNNNRVILSSYLPDLKNHKEEEIQTLIGEIDMLIRDILNSADKVILNGASLMAYLHTEARKSLVY